MAAHLRRIHQWHRRHRRPLLHDEGFKDVTDYPIACQTFHKSSFVRYFAVTSSQEALDTPTSTAGNSQRNNDDPQLLSLQEQVEQALKQKLQAQKAFAHKSTSRHQSEISPWLDETR
jgi:hypothetical protein